MKLSRLPVVVTGIALVGAGMWWLARRDHQPELNQPFDPISVVVKPLSKRAEPGTSADALPEFGTEEFNKMAKERGAAWLANRNRDASSLLALWDLTGDEEILREAGENFPGNPKVCLAMLVAEMKKEDNAEEQKKWTDLLIAAAPENPLGYFYQARLAQVKGEGSGVVAALETALSKKGRIDHYLRERMVTAKEGLLASGVPLKEAYTLSMAGPMTKSSGGIVEIAKIMGFFKNEMASMKSSGRETELQELAALGLRVAEQQRIMESPSLLTELVAHGWRTRFLEDLDPKTEIGSSGRTVAEELGAATTEGEKLTKMVKDVESAHKYFDSASLEVQGQYADRMMMDGEMAAMKFLLEKIAAP